MAKVTAHPAQRARRQRCLELLLSGRTATEIAAELGIDRRTIYRWRQDPEFAEAVQERQDEVRDTIHAALVAMTPDAMAALRGSFDAVKVDMARIKAVQVWSELLGLHKNAPARPVERTAELETEADLQRLLEDVPLPLLRAAMEAKERKRAG